MKIRERDHELINPLNNVLMLAYDTPQYEKIEQEVMRVVDILVRERIITRRKGQRIGSDTGNG